MYPVIRSYLQNYAREGADEKRAVSDFIVCESTEVLASFKAELTGILLGEPDEQVLERIIGPGRKKKHGTYKEWAKLMLMLIATNK